MKRILFVIQILILGGYSAIAGNPKVSVKAANKAIFPYKGLNPQQAAVLLPVVDTVIWPNPNPWFNSDNQYMGTIAFGVYNRTFAFGIDTVIWPNPNPWFNSDNAYLGLIWYNIYLRTIPTGTGGGVFWTLLGNTGTNPNTNFLGTIDAQDLAFKVNNIKSGLIDIGSNNTFFGYKSNAGPSTGTNNTGIGASALKSNTSGKNNTALGDSANYSGTNQHDNTIIGYTAHINAALAVNNSVVIGSNVACNTANTVQLGNANDSIIFLGTGGLSTSAGAANVYYNSATGQLEKGVSGSTSLDSSYTGAGIPSWYKLGIINLANRGMKFTGVLSDSTTNTTILQQAIDDAQASGFHIVPGVDTGTAFIGGTFHSIGTTGHTELALVYVKTDTSSGNFKPVTFDWPSDYFSFNARYHNGVFLKVYKSRATDGQHTIVGCQIGNSSQLFYNNVKPVFNNVNIACRYDAGLNGIDMYWAGTATTSNCYFRGDTNTFGYTGVGAETRPCYAVITPGKDNNEECIFYNVKSIGWYGGVLLGGHSLLTYPSITYSVHAISAVNCYAGSTIDHFELNSDEYALDFPTVTKAFGATSTNSIVNIFGGSIGGGAGVWAPITGIMDSANKGYGTITYAGYNFATIPYYPAAGNGGPTHLSIMNTGVSQNGLSGTSGMALGTIPYATGQSYQTQTDASFVRNRDGSYNATYGELQVGTAFTSTFQAQNSILANFSGTANQGLGTFIENTNGGTGAYAYWLMGNGTYVNNCYILGTAYSTGQGAINSPYGNNAVNISNNNIPASATSGVSIYSAHAVPTKIFTNGTITWMIDNNGRTLQGGQKVSTGSNAAVQDSGSFAITATTGGIKLPNGGTNATSGQATLNGSGTVTVSTTAALTASRIFLTYTGGGVVGTVSNVAVSSISNATSFTIVSSNPTDSGTVNWWIINVP